MTGEDIFREVGIFMREAMSRRKERPALCVLDYMKAELESAMFHQLEPNWGKIIKKAKKIWNDNL